MDDFKILDLASKGLLSNHLLAKVVAKEMLQSFSESKLLKSLIKSSAIHRIKMQPFFGDTLLKSKSGTVKFRRPIKYVV